MKRNTLILFFILLTLPMFGQKNVIQRAMEDELNRNMTELRLDTLDKPFYISCSIQDVKVYSITASMGGIISSFEMPRRFKSDRVLVGGYEFNDESVDNNLFSAPEPNDIDLPLDDDYWGIRRALWVSMDNVYKNAARQFSQNKATLRDQKKPLDEIPHRTFAKVPAPQLSLDFTPPSFNQAQWEDNLRKLSGRFVHTAFPGSTVTFNYVSGYKYFVSSEGASIKVPVQQTFLQVTVVGRDDEGEISYDQNTWSGRTPHDLPMLSQLELNVDALIAQLEESKKLKKFEEEYTGPVLFEGSSVVDIFSGVLFGGRERLMFDNNIQSLTGLRTDRGTTMESRIGKSIVSPSLTVKALAHLKMYNDTDLLGAFEADSEGVVPPDEVVLIEKGILKDLLNDRTITSPLQKANGHRDGPGVIMVSASDAIHQKDLKTKLIAQAKEAGLDYALMVRGGSPVRLGMFTVYKVNVSDGKEEMLRSARLSSLAMKNMRKVITSVEQAVYNMPAFEGELSFTSYIVPQALLVGEIDIVNAELPMYKEEEFVKSPSKK